MVARRPSSNPVSASRNVLAHDAASMAPDRCVRLKHVAARRHRRALQFRVQFAPDQRSEAGDDDEFRAEQLVRGFGADRSAPY